MKDLRLRSDIEFDFSAFVALGADSFRASVEFSSKPTPDNLAQLNNHMAVFVAAVRLAMGAGREVEPRIASESELKHAISPVDRASDDFFVTYDFKGLVFDPGYALVLINKLQCLVSIGSPIKSVNLQLLSLNEGLTKVEIDQGYPTSFPALHPSVPSAWQTDLNDYGDSLEVRVGFYQQPDEAQVAFVNDAFSIWVAQIVQGGFISSTYDLASFCLIPDAEIQVVGNEINWRGEKAWFDMQAINGLLHFFAAFSTQYLPVQYVEVE